MSALSSPSSSCSSSAPTLQQRRRKQATIPAIGKYGPSQHQVDLVYREMMKAYNNAVDPWQGVDRKLLIQKVRNKFQKEHPELFEEQQQHQPAPSSCTAGGGGDDEEDLDKKKVVVADAAASSSPVSNERDVKGGPIIFRGVRMPKEVVAHFIPYCDRASINNFSLMCRGALHVIQDRKVVPVLPWPVDCPVYQRRRYDNDTSFIFDGRILNSIISSNDGSRIAVIKERGWHQREQELPNHYDIQIWDRFQGLIGEMTYYDIGQRPVFSPDNKLLIAGFVEEGEGQDEDGYDLITYNGLQVVQLPVDKRREPIVVSNHQPWNGGEETEDDFPRPFVFVGSSSIATMENNWADGDEVTNRLNWKYELNIRTINHESNNGHHISFSSEYQTIMRFNSHFTVAAFFDRKRNKAYLAVRCWDDRNKLIFYDMQSNKSISQILEFPPTDDLNDLVFLPLSFSNNGTLVAASGGSFAVYDFASANAIEEIGQPRFISSPLSGSWRRSTSFSPDGTKMLVRFATIQQASRSYRICIIDLQTEATIYDSWDDDADYDSVWNMFINN